MVPEQFFQVNKIGIQRELCTTFFNSGGMIQMILCVFVHKIQKKKLSIKVNLNVRFSTLNSRQHEGCVYSKTNPLIEQKSNEKKMYKYIQ